MKNSTGHMRLPRRCDIHLAGNRIYCSRHLVMDLHAIPGSRRDIRSGGAVVSFAVSCRPARCLWTNLEVEVQLPGERELQEVRP